MSSGGLTDAPVSITDASGDSTGAATAAPSALAGKPPTLDAGAAPSADDPPADAPPAYADEPFFTRPFEARRSLPEGAPARQIANLSPADCKRRLSALKLPVTPWGGAAKGVATPLKLSGPIAGVQFVIPGGKSPYGVLDCRLVLALRQLASLLEPLGVIRVQIDNAYRPAAKLPSRRKQLSQHAHALALDVTRLWLKSGEVLVVEADWQGSIKEPACGPEVRLHEPSERAVRLRNVFCAIAEAGLFNHLLTPGHDAAHRDHFHLDLKRDTTYQVVR